MLLLGAALEREPEDRAVRPGQRALAEAELRGLRLARFPDDPRRGRVGRVGVGRPGVHHRQPRRRAHQPRPVHRPEPVGQVEDHRVRRARNPDVPLERPSRCGAVRQGENGEHRRADAAQDVPEKPPHEPLPLDCAVQATAGDVETHVGVTEAQDDDRLVPPAPDLGILGPALDALGEPAQLSRSLRVS